MKKYLLMGFIISLSLSYYLIFDEEDVTTPVFSNIPSAQTIEYGVSFDLNSLGLTAIDDFDGDISNKITNNFGNTRLLDLGEYIITYTVKDNSGNTVSTNIELSIVDTTAPVVSINPDIFQYTFEIGSTEPVWTDFFIVEDNYDTAGYLFVRIPESVDMDTLGTYDMSVSFTDNARNTSDEVTIIINIVEEWTDLIFFDYELINDNTEVGIVLYDFTGPKDVVLPLYIEGLPVTSIGPHSFNAKLIESIIIPDTVDYIGSYAFAHNNLTTFDFPPLITEINDNTFSNNLLTEVILPQGVTSIGKQAFYQNEIENLILPEGLTSIGFEAFLSNSIDVLSLPESLTHIGPNAFTACGITSVNIPLGLTILSESVFSINNLTNIDIPANITEIDRTAFSDNSITSYNVSNENQYYKSVNGILYDKEMTILISYPVVSAIDTFIVPETVTVIGSVAFSDAIITNVVLPEGLLVIEEGAFYRSTITTINFPDSLTTIGRFAFNDTSLNITVYISKNLTEIGERAFTESQIIYYEVDEDNPNYTSVEGVLFTKDLSELLDFPSGDTRTTYTIPNEVQIVSLFAFRYNSFTSITIPDEPWWILENWGLLGLDYSLMPEEYQFGN